MEGWIFVTLLVGLEEGKKWERNEKQIVASCDEHLCLQKVKAGVHLVYFEIL